MKLAKYFLIFSAMLIELVGLLIYSHYAHGLFYGLEFLLILLLTILTVVILLTLDYDTKLPNFLLLLFFVIAVLNALLFYFLYDSTRLFAVMTVVGAIGIIIAINLFHSAGRVEKSEIEEIVEEVVEKKPAKKKAKRKSQRKK